MSGVDLSEFRSAYVAEADELLAAANRNLLAIDAAVRKGEQHPRAVRELFRAMHTIKGLSGMVGVEPVVAIAHRIEAGLRAADRAASTLDARAVDAMLRAIRDIEVRVRAFADGREVPPAPAELLDALEHLGDGRPAAAPAATAVALDEAVAARLTDAEREQLLRRVAAGMRAVQLDFAPTPARLEAGTNITTVRERLERIAELVRVVPRSMPVDDETPGGLVFTLLLVTTATNEEVAAAAKLEAAAVRTIAAPPAAPPSMPSFLEADTDEEADAISRRDVVRVDVARLDDAMERLSALIVTRYRLARAVQSLAARNADVRELDAIVKDNARQLRDLRAAILRVRMVAVAEVLDRVPLLVRGLSRATGKPIALEADVGRTEVDKTVAERIFPAIVHLVRNAIDHGIEPAEERARAGKPEQARVRVAAIERSNTQLEITVEDDGRGIDAATVARRAGRELPKSAAELLQLLCMPGLSTREEATTTSGRGMGMDIVRRTVVDQLGGELILDTTPGQGTRFVLRVPLTISIVDAFTFEAAGERYCVPVASVEEIVDVEPDKLVRPPGAGAETAAMLGMLERRGQALPLVALPRLFGLTSDGGRKALVVRRSGEVIAFAVDRLLGQQEVVLRPLEDPLVRVPGVTGATDLGDGRPTLVLDLFALVARDGAKDAAA